jgi:AAA domain
MHDITDNAALDAKAIQLDRRGRFILFGELGASSTKEWLVHNLLGHGEASTIYGKPGDGKSVLAEDLGLHVAAGWPWHGRPVRRGAVLYIALDRRELVKRRAIAFRKKHEVLDLPFAIVGGLYDFRDKRTVANIVEIAREVEELTGEQLVLIEIDTLSRALCGGDENSPKDMGAIVASTTILQQGTGAHVLWIHHIPVDGGERLRGHGALLGAMDTTISVAKAGASRIATVAKANDSEEGAQVAFTLESVSIGQDAEGIETTTAPVVVPAKLEAGGAIDPKLTKNQQTMFSVLHGSGSSGLTAEQWNDGARQAGLGISRKADLYDFRAALKSKGFVRQYGDRWTVTA